MASPQSLDKDFNASYAKRGLQPSVGSVRPIRNTNVEYRTDPTLRRGGLDKSSVPLAQPTPPTQAENDPYYEAANDFRYTVNPARDTTNLSAPSQTPRFSPASKIRSRYHNALQSKINGKVLLAKARARSVTLSIWSWGFPTWLSFQLLFAALSILMLSIGVAGSQLRESVSVPNETDGYWVTAGKKVVGTVFDFEEAKAAFLNDTVLAAFDIDFRILDPTNLFFMFHILVMAYGLLVLFAIYFIYTFAFLKPLSGQGSGMKMGALLLATIGYSIPILNLLPWFLPWTLVVWLHPK